jgi:hypothetical protein
MLRSSGLHRNVQVQPPFGAAGTTAQYTERQASLCFSHFYIKMDFAGIEVNPGPECQTDEQIAGLCDGHTKDVGIQSCTDWLKAHFNSTWRLSSIQQHT